MHPFAYRATTFIIGLAVAVNLHATDVHSYTLPDSVSALPAATSTLQSDEFATSVAADSVRPEKLNLIQKIIRYFDDANKERPDKKFDITFLGGPSYSESTSFQLALVAAGLYRTRRDSATLQSNVSVFGQGSVTGFYRVGV